MPSNNLQFNSAAKVLVDVSLVRPEVVLIAPRMNIRTMGFFQKVSNFKGGRCQNSGRKIANKSNRFYKARGLPYRQSVFLLPITYGLWFLRTQYASKLRPLVSSVVESSAGIRLLTPSSQGGTIGSLITNDFGLNPLLMDRGFLPLTFCVRPLSAFEFGSRVWLLVSSYNRIAWCLGSFITVITSADDLTLVVLPSGQLSIFSQNWVCTDFDDGSRESSTMSDFPIISKVGSKRMRQRGHRHSVRGIVKNTCDHPHGGSKDGVLRPRTPWNKVILKSKRKQPIVNLDK